MNDTSPTAMEMAVFIETCKQLPAEDRSALEQQTYGILVRSRENTGAGFYTYFTVTTKAASPISSDTKNCDVRATVNGVDEALGFILWLKDGYVDCLEGYTLSLDSTAGMDFSNLNFQIKTTPPTQRT